MDMSFTLQKCLKYEHLIKFLTKSVIIIIPGKFSTFSSLERERERGYMCWGKPKIIASNRIFDALHVSLKGVFIPKLEK